MAGKSIIKVAYVDHPERVGSYQLTIVEQSYRGMEFCESDGGFTDPASGWTLRSIRFPEVNPGSKILYVWGSHPDKDVTAVTVTKDQLDGILAAVDAYNRHHGGVSQGTSQQKQEAKAVLSIDTVIIAPAAKERLRAALAQKKHWKLIFDTWGLGNTIEKGRAISLLFYGPPGTGKTMMAQAIANEFKMNLKILQTAELESSVPGQMERNTQKAFADAKTNNHLLLFDECDSLIYDRADIGMILAAQVNCLLSCLEKFEGIVVFTTNRLGVLDQAFERRLALKLEFPFPDEDARELIWKKLIPKEMPLEKRVDYRRLASVPLSGGHIKNCILAAARLAAYKELECVTGECFIQAISQELGSQEAFRQAMEEQRAPGLRKWIEFGSESWGVVSGVIPLSGAGRE